MRGPLSVLVLAKSRLKPRMDNAWFILFCREANRKTRHFYLGLRENQQEKRVDPFSGGKLPLKLSFKKGHLEDTLNKSPPSNKVTVEQ